MLHLRAALPAKVTVRGVPWKIELRVYQKGRRAELLSKGSNGIRGVFIDGRTDVVESHVRLGILVPVGTVRYTLALALAAEGLTTINHV